MASEVSDAEKTDKIKFGLQAVIDKEAKKMPKSAPTSANGSNNPNPTLDIQVTLPRGNETEDEGDMDSYSRRERR